MKRPRLRSSAQKPLAGVVEVSYHMKNICFLGFHRFSWVDVYSSVVNSALFTSETKSGWGTGNSLFSANLHDPFIRT